MNRLIIVLDENPTTGYRWEVQGADISEDIFMASSGTAGSGSEKEICGKGGERYIKVELDTSEPTITLRLLREWEKDHLAKEIIIVQRDIPHDS